MTPQASEPEAPLHTQAGRASPQGSRPVGPPPHAPHTLGRAPGSRCGNGFPGSKEDAGDSCPGRLPPAGTLSTPSTRAASLGARQVCGRFPYTDAPAPAPPPLPAGASAQLTSSQDNPAPGEPHAVSTGSSPWLTLGTAVSGDHRAGPWGGAGVQPAPLPGSRAPSDEEGGSSVRPPGRTTGGNPPSLRAGTACWDAPAPAGQSRKWAGPRSEPAGIWSGRCRGSAPGAPAGVSDTHLKGCSIYMGISGAD